MTFQKIKDTVGFLTSYTDSEFREIFKEVYESFCVDTNYFRRGNKVSVTGGGTGLYWNTIDSTWANMSLAWNSEVAEVSDAIFGNILKIFVVKNLKDDHIYTHEIHRVSDTYIELRIFNDKMERVESGDFYLYYAFSPYISLTDLNQEFIFPSAYFSAIESALLSKAYLKKGDIYLKNEDIELHTACHGKSAYYNSIVNDIKTRARKHAVLSENTITTLGDVMQHDLGGV